MVAEVAASRSDTGGSRFRVCQPLFSGKAGKCSSAAVGSIFGLFHDYQQQPIGNFENRVDRVMYPQ